MQLVKLQLHWQILIGMTVGAALGLLVNWMWSHRETTLTDGLPNGVQEATIVDTADTSVVRWTTADGSTHTVTVDPTGSAPGSYVTLDDAIADHPVLAQLYPRGMSYAKYAGALGRRIGGWFLRLLQMISVPLIITSLATGVLGLGAASRLRRMFTTTLIYYVCTSMLAIFVGIALTNLIRPGLGTNIRLDVGRPQVEPTTLGETLLRQIEALIPTNPFAAIVASEFLSIISFTLLVCIVALQVGGDTHRRLEQLASDGFEVMMRLTMGIIKLAPWGVLLLMFYVTATQGAAVFRALAWYLLTVTGGLLLHAVVTLPLIVWFLARRNPFQLMQAMMPALLTAFSSASSNATLPLTLSCIEKRAGVRNSTGSFVLPLGATINMDGTALYEAVAVLFIGQIYHGGDFGLTQQIAVAITALLASIGAAGIPHAGLVMMAIVLQAVDLPLEFQGIILAVDRVLDMLRTAVNVWSDSCGAAVVDHLVGESSPSDLTTNVTVHAPR
ncbi:MAG: hypothetical protein KatS3mg111_3238 [Pirellulaceae bacterium]|nr:MAG: hypothetical protein KatS3mg111_3238 [Pirellulaceae bacterium]